MPGWRLQDLWNAWVLDGHLGIGKNILPVYNTVQAVTKVSLESWWLWASLIVLMSGHRLVRFSWTRTLTERTWTWVPSGVQWQWTRQVPVSVPLSSCHSPIMFTTLGRLWISRPTKVTYIDLLPVQMWNVEMCHLVSLACSAHLKRYLRTLDWDFGLGSLLWASLKIVC